MPENNSWKKFFDGFQKDPEPTDFDKVLGNLAKKIHKNTAEFNREVKAIRTDENLSVKGRQVQLSELFTRYSKLHKQLRAEMEQKRTEVQKELSRAVFAPSSKDLPAFNASLDRLDTIRSEDELNKIIRRAERIDDTITLQASILFASEKGYNHALDQLAEILPDKAAGLDRLADFQVRWGSRRELSTRFQEKAYTSAPQRPLELPSVNPTAE